MIIRIHNKHNEIYKHDSKTIRYNATLISTSCMCCSYMLRVCTCCVFVDVRKTWARYAGRKLLRAED